MIDLHCHILPGLDDGANSLDEAVEMARMAEDDGIRKIVATPHLFRGEFTPNDLGLIEEKKQELVKALKKMNINIEVFTGAEVHISHNLIGEIRKNRKFLVINQSSYMFVEFPSEHVFSGVKDLFFNLMSEGITPVITHPERNSIFIRNSSMLYELVQMGSFCQANSGSFTGLYGLNSQKAVHRFLELGLIHFISSDCHNTRSIIPKLSEAVIRASGIVGEVNATALVEENPQAVLDNQEIPYFPAPVSPGEREKSLKIKIPSLFRKRE